MAKEPTYPEESPVGNPDAVEANAGEDKKQGSGRTKHLVTGAAIGIGSAALVAALLYANRSKKAGGDS
jgi:hypothetical protein